MTYFPQKQIESIFQWADMDPANIAGGQAVSGSRLFEVGVKGSFLDERLFTQLAWYRQKRTDFSAKNLSNERYFRANFPNLFGSSIVLPELPRHYQASLRYRF